MLRRRDFLLLSAATLAFAGRAAQAGATTGRKTLILIELKGGNDGLNLIAPLRDPLYRRLRPDLALDDKEAFSFGSGLFLHPGLLPLASAVEGGELAAVLNVGYPRPNRSHFRSIEIWDQASASDEVLDEGWVTRALRARGPVADGGLDGILLDSDEGPLEGARTLALHDDEELTKLAATASSDDTRALSPAARHIVAMRAHVRASARTIAEQTARVRMPALDVAPPKGGRRGLSPKALESTVRLSLADTGVSVLKLTLPGFDTHTRQRETQDRLLATLGANLAALRAALREAGAWDSVTVMVTSEFGRRVAQNQNGGTDHGAACPVLLLGSAVQGGVHGTPYRLDDLDDGDLRATTEHRDVFAAVARHMWGDAAGRALMPTRAMPLFST